jgi:UDP-N-acetylmuramoyl-L-alanyl-D-glutamate--2,6-diaminopimelate ligase
VELSWEGTRIALEAGPRLADVGAKMPRALRVRAIGSIYAENALAALLGAIAAGADAARAAEAIALAPPPPGRFEIVHERPWVVIDYAHSPDALERTVATARALCDGGANGGLTIVFGAGGKRDKAKRAPMGAAARPADRVILTSDNPRNEDPADIARALAAGLEGHARVDIILDRSRAIATAIADAGADDVVLIAGKGHETEQVAGGVTRAFSDAAVAREAARARRRFT